MRTRLTEALNNAAIMPDWFLDTFGPVAPATRRKEWMETALGVLLYRTIYTITDPHHPLGKPPAATDSAHRGRWHRKLQGQIRALTA
jgi:hypothetical protein